MRLVQIPRAYRGLRRFQTIVQILVRYGFWDILDRMGLVGRYARVQARLRRLPRPPKEYTTPQRVRLALQELGPTFIKLGQFLSLRSDLLPPPWTEELARLQDRVDPQPFHELRPVLDAMLPEWQAQCRELDPEPIGSASIAQVHRAVLADGRTIALKIRRPNINRLVRVDMDILAFLADLADQYLEELRPFRLPHLVAQARRVLEREIDLRIEAQQAERFAHNFQDSPDIVVPEVVWDWVAEGVMASAYIEGLRIDDLAVYRPQGLDPKRVALCLARALMKQIFLDGFFHGDPHPGNFWVLPDERIAVLDFGIMGTLDPETQDHLAQVFLGVVQQDTHRLVRGLIHMGILEEPPTSAFLQDLQDLIGRYRRLPLHHIDLDLIYAEVTALMRRHHLALPHDLALMFKTMAAFDSLLRRLDPGFPSLEVARPFVRHMMYRRFHPLTFGRRLVEQTEQILNLALTTPLEFEWFWHQFRRGQWPIPMELRNLPRLETALTRGLNRVALALLVMGLVLSSSVLVLRPIGPQWMGLPLVALAGFTASLVLSLVLAWLIVRS